jgi:hypothetical protein
MSGFGLPAGSPYTPVFLPRRLCSSGHSSIKTNSDEILPKDRLRFDSCLIFLVEQYFRAWGALNLDREATQLAAL